MNPNEQKILELGECADKESRQVDFKERLDPTLAIDWSNIVKHMIAMANSGGGILIFGIADNGTYSEFDRNIVLNIDPATIADKIYSYTGENFSDFKILEVTRRPRRLAA